MYMYIYIYTSPSSGRTLVTCSKLSAFCDVTSATKNKIWMVQYAPKHVGEI